MSDSEGRRGRFTPLKRLSDDELAAEAARGDDKAFALLFERLQDPLYRYTLSILGNPEEARDALQNAMLKAYRALRGETREIAARPWLYRIARNEAVSALRGRRPLGELEEAVGVAAAAGAGADADAAARERLSDLVSDLRSLPERQRSALVLRELSGLDYEELGAALDISPNAARQTVFKARVSMQATVEGRTAHCDEVRAAMSKNDGRFRRRRSIQAHLERCSVCTEFATGLEHRPRDLAALFPPLPAGVAAAMLTAASGGAAGSAATAGGAASSAASAAGAASGGAGSGGSGAASGGAASGGSGAASAGASGSGTPASGPAASGAPARGTGLRPRRALVLALLLLLLLGGTVATAVLVNDGDDGSDAPSEIAQQPAAGEGDTGSGDSGGGAGGEGDGSGAQPDAGEEQGTGSARDREDGDRSDDTESGGSGGSEDRGSDSRETPESGSGSESGDSEPGSSGSSGSRGDDDPSEDATPRGRDCVERTVVRRSSPAQDAYSNRGGRVEVQIREDCTPTRSAQECVGSGTDGGSGSGDAGSGAGEGSGSGSGGEGGSGSGAGSGGEDGSGANGGGGEGDSGEDGSEDGSGEGSGSADGSASGGDDASGGGEGSRSGAAGSQDGSGSDDCARTTRDGLPITGLELGLICGCALLLLGLGLTLRRVAAAS
jgi:RNA polymerase sigma factor (sigma-70 family)